MTKSSVNRMYLKQVLCSHKKNCEKAISDQLDELNKLNLDLKSIDIQIDDKDHTLLFLCYLSKTHYLKI